MNSLGDRLKSLRGGTPREKYAPKLGVSLTTIANYEGERRSPDAVFLQKILEIHKHVNPTWLLTGEGPMERCVDQQQAVPAAFKRSLLKDVVEAVEEHLNSRDLELAPDKKAELIALLYEMFAEKEEKKVDKAVVLSLVKLAA